MKNNKGALQVVTSVLSLLIISSQTLKSQNGPGRVTHYDLEIKIDLKQNSLHAESQLLIKNETSEEISELDFILYHMLEVNSIKIDGQPVNHDQEVKPFVDWESFRVNHINLQLQSPILPSESKQVSVTYSGTLQGYVETGVSYIKDHISSDFTILRPDCLAYPVLGKPSFTTFKNIASEHFDYQIKITVPDSHYAVNGGTLIDKNSKVGWSTFHYKSLKPTYQIVTTVADYEILQKDNKIFTYHFKKDTKEAIVIHKEMLRTIELYSELWSEPIGNDRFSLIEIPEGYGSQATENYIIQTATAFSDPNQIKQLYHELSHLWNVKSLDQFPPRWNEGLATFVENYTIEKIEGRSVLDSIANAYAFILKNDSSYAQFPMIDYGKNNATDKSYRTGFMFFYLIHKRIGEKDFNEVIRTFYNRYSRSGASTDTFVQHVKSVSKKNLDNIFEDWLYTNEFFKQLAIGKSIAEILKSYGSG